ncbi:hypothetical protein D3C71_1265220 [compost metagenome]
MCNNVNVGLIKEKRKQLRDLVSKKHGLNHKIDKRTTDDLKAYPEDKQSSNVTDYINKEQSRIDRLRNFLTENTDITTIRDLLVGFSRDAEEMQVVDNEISKVGNEIEQLLMLFDICPECLNSGEVYDYELIRGDPYARSREAMRKCHVCKGTKKYVQTKKIK